VPLKVGLGEKAAAGFVGATLVAAFNLALMALNAGPLGLGALGVQVAATVALVCLAVLLMTRGVSYKRAGRLILIGVALMSLMALAWHVKTRVLGSTSELAEWIIFLLRVTGNVLATVGVAFVLLHRHIGIRDEENP